MFIARLSTLSRNIDLAEIFVSLLRTWLVSLFLFPLIPHLPYRFAYVDPEGITSACSFWNPLFIFISVAVGFKRYKALKYVPFVFIFDYTRIYLERFVSISFFYFLLYVILPFLIV